MVRRPWDYINRVRLYVEERIIEDEHVMYERYIYGINSSFGS